ncbi:MAG: DNA/RNA nuclease SfsA [Eubacteriaceae bacterium]|nr:DNA/RNA nuclease SfsA [Eubacteriaceae bacterium]
MEYPNIKQAVFLSRPNRFIALVLTDGQEERVHIKNTGRLSELLTPGRTVYLCESGNPNRKTRYDLVAVKRGEGFVNIDSMAPNAVAPEVIRRIYPDMTLIKGEVTHGASRFDYYIQSPQRKIFAEIKGCTLERGGVALFPDAPTERGIKHINGLISALAEGYGALFLIVVQMKGPGVFSPNEETSPDFAEALRRAEERGVVIKAVDCLVTPERITPNEFIAVNLQGAKQK